MVAVLPAIIAESREDLKKKLDLVRADAEWVQVDVMDGEFVSRKSWPYSDGSADDIATLKGNLKVEVHLMVSKPEGKLAEWIRSGVDRILVHYEATEELGVIIDILRGTGIEWGLVLKLETPIEVIDAWAGECGLVLLMAIAEIGYQGHVFEEAVIPKVRALRLKYPELRIEIDGGVTIENALRLREAGADAVTVGGALFNTEDPAASLREFKKTLNDSL